MGQSCVFHPPHRSEAEHKHSSICVLHVSGNIRFTCRELIIPLRSVSLITATLLFPLSLFLWRRVKQRLLRRKIEKEFEDDIALEQMPVLLEYPAKAHFEKSA